MGPIRKRFLLLISCLFSVLFVSGCAGPSTDSEQINTWMENSEMEFEEPGEEIRIRIIAGDQVVDAILFGNGTAQTFARMLPLTVDLWTPIHYAQAFDLPRRIPDRDTRTREYEQGAIGYWYEGPSIALLYGEDEEQTAVPIVKIGKMTSNVSVFETYRDSVRVELVEPETDESHQY